MPDLKFFCPECRQKIGVDLLEKGREVRCPTCRSVLVIPNSAMQPVQIIARNHLPAAGEPAAAVPAQPVAVKVAVPRAVVAQPTAVKAAVPRAVAVQPTAVKAAVPQAVAVKATAVPVTAVPVTAVAALPKPAVDLKPAAVAADDGEVRRVREELETAIRQRDDLKAQLDLVVAERDLLRATATKRSDLTAAQYEASNLRTQLIEKEGELAVSHAERSRLRQRLDELDALLRVGQSLAGGASKPV